MTENLTIYQLIQQQAENNGNYSALLDTENLRLTYADLFTQINHLIEQLRLFDLNLNEKIAIALPNGLAMAVTFLAVSSSAICCPLNPKYRQTEYEFYLSDLNAKALITQQGVNPNAVMVAEKLNIPVIYLSSPTDINSVFTLELANNKFYPVKNLELNYKSLTLPQLDDIALILHTSGTTSRPKQVPLTHGNLCTSAHNISKTLKLIKSDRSLNIMPLFHIHGLIGVLLSSMSVSASVICSQGFNSDKFLTWLAQLQATWYSAVPTIHQQLLTQAKQQPEILAQIQLRLIRSSSASLPPQVMAELEKTFNVPVIEAYGMTEASHQMTSNPLPPQTRKPSSVGIPQGLEVAIMDEDGNLLKTGKIGEVVIKGNNVTHGYLNNALANEKAFTNGWFRTGDLGYLDEDGYLFLQGRIKEVINRGGEKIMPLEVDNVVMELPQVYQAVTFGVNHQTLGEDVAIAVVLKPNQTITPQQIREYLFQHLADFKIPSQVIIVDEIPKGATGKLQRIGLAEKLTYALQIEKIAPRNEIESKIANIFQEVLNVTNISIKDNFFVLGGDSLKGTQAINRINQIFNLDLINVILFQKPTIEELVLEIDNQTRQKETEEINQLANQLKNLTPEEISQLLGE